MSTNVNSDQNIPSCQPSNQQQGKSSHCVSCQRPYIYTEKSQDNCCPNCFNAHNENLNNLFSYYSEKYNGILHKKFIFNYASFSFLSTLCPGFNEEQFAQKYFSKYLLTFAEKIARYSSGGQKDTQENILKIFGKDFVRKTYLEQTLCSEISAAFNLGINDQLPFDNTDHFWNVCRENYDTLNAYNSNLAIAFRAFVKTQIKTYKLVLQQPQKSANALFASFLENEINLKANKVHGKYPEIRQSNVENYTLLYTKIPGIKSKTIKQVMLKTIGKFSGVDYAKKFYCNFILGMNDDEAKASDLQAIPAVD